MTNEAEVLGALCELLGERLPGLTVIESGMEADVEWRYGRVTICFDHDREAESIRVFIRLPPPAGAGPGFLTWCLSTNILYWDVKLGLDAQGMLIAHADVDLEQADMVSTAEVLLARIDAMSEMLDDDLVNFIGDHGLATPAQQSRWEAWQDPTPSA